MKRIYLPIWCALIIGALMASGCLGPRQGWTSYPRASIERNPYFVAEIKPVSLDNKKTGFHGFLLVIQNRSDEDLRIVWHETKYIDGRRSRFGFIVGEKQNRNPDEMLFERPDIVFENHIYQERIWPKYLASKDPKTGQWRQKAMVAGTHGIFLNIMYKDIKIPVDLHMSIVEE